jgi:putative phosphoribosyl transferase
VIFRDRQEAGHLLAARLAHFRGQPDALILGLARGGVLVARAVAEELQLPWEILIVRKLGVPWQPELALGAVAEDSEPIFDPTIFAECALPQEEVDRMVARERHEIARRQQIYRGGRKLPPLRGLTVIVVDDGLATGSSMLAAVRALRVDEPARIVVAVPVGPLSTCHQLRGEADEVVCLETPQHFGSVGSWYDDFRQVSDQEVRQAGN